MPKLETVTGTAPSAWASYLVNGDASGIDDADVVQVDAFAAWLGGHVVDCEDAGFMHRHDASQFGALAADCQTYSALVDVDNDCANCEGAGCNNCDTTHPEA